MTYLEQFCPCWAYDSALWSADTARRDWMLWCIPMVSNRLPNDATMCPLHNGDIDVLRAVARDICET
eukprot:4297188-Pyramimonas_sp.AAC.1